MDISPQSYYTARVIMSNAFWIDNVRNPIQELVIWTLIIIILCGATTSRENEQNNTMAYRVQPMSYDCTLKHI